MTELCIHCGQPTPYDQSNSLSSLSTTPAAQVKKEERKGKKVKEEIKTITLTPPHQPTLADQQRYEQIINKDQITNEEREELRQLYQKYNPANKSTPHKKSKQMRKSTG